MSNSANKDYFKGRREGGGARENPKQRENKKLTVEIFASIKIGQHRGVPIDRT